jgi:TusA-related sulfurtransferase
MLLDVRGEICPYPMIRTVDALEKLRPDEELEVLTDHPPALTTIPWEAAKRGYTVDVEKVASGEWKLVLKRASGPLDPVRVLQQVAQKAQEGG